MEIQASSAQKWGHQEKQYHFQQYDKLYQEKNISAEMLNGRNGSIALFLGTPLLLEMVVAWEEILSSFTERRQKAKYEGLASAGNGRPNAAPSRQV